MIHGVGKTVDNFIPDDKRVDISGHVKVPVVKKEGIVPPEVTGECRWKTTGAGDHADISAVPKGLRATTPDGLCAVRTYSPHISWKILKIF